MSVVGFDIGNESCVIAVAKRGGVDVLLNDESKRETPAVVSFGEKQRFLGSAGAAFATANPKSTISQLKRLIGKLYKEVEDELKLLPFPTSEGPRGGILIELKYLKKDWTFTPVEILGMLFKHLKQIAEKNLESVVGDCVIGIPSYFTDLQRRLYLDAAMMAGLKPLRLMHEGTAIALGYGMYKTDLSKSRPTYVMFVDIGHCDTQVTVVAFEQGRMKILSHSFDPNLGGRDFDEVLFKHFAAQFIENYKLDVYSHARASARLRASCEKVKKVLSVNAEAPISIDCLIGDTDVRGVITRVEFENLSSSLLKRVIVPCKVALRDSGLSVDKLYTTELAGSGSRIPAITSVLVSFLKKEPTRTLNASECVARGCALRCAMLSPSLQVREYEIKDSFPYSIVIPLPQGEYTLFPKGSEFPSNKKTDHIRNTPFYLQVAYVKERDFPAGMSHIIGHFGIESENPEAEKKKVDFGLKLNDHGIVEMDFATIVEDKWHFGELLMMTDNSPMVNLTVSENVDVSTTDDELVEAIKKEKMLTEQDIKVEKTKDQRNTLESFVYNTRSKLLGIYKKFATESEEVLLANKLQETEDRLYEDSDDESEQDYTGRLEYLKKLLEPIEHRYNEENAVAKAKESLQTCIAKYHSQAESLPPDMKEKVKNICARAEQWFSELSQTNSPPKTLLTMINKKIDDVERKCESITRPVPSVQRHQKSMDSNRRGPTEESEQRDLHVELQTARAIAAKPLETCIDKYYLLANSLPPDKKKQVENVCWQARQWLTSFLSQKDTFPTDINQAIHFVESKCNNIIQPEASIPKHKEPVGSDQSPQTIESNQKDRPANSQNAILKATEALQNRIAKYRSQAESLPPDMKEKVKDVCMRAEQWLNRPSSSNNLTAINDIFEAVERHCQTIIRSAPSFRSHEEVEPMNPNQSDQIHQPVDSDHREEQMDVDQVGQSMDSDERDPYVDNQVHK